MADDDRNRGYRDNDAYRRQRPQQPAQSSEDPLAELARLIGHQNEAAPSYRQNGARSPYGQDAHQEWAHTDTHAQRDGYRQDSDGSRSPSSYSGNSYPDNYESPPVAYGDGRYDPRYDSAAHGDPGYGSQYSPGYGDPRQADPRQTDPRYAEPQYQDNRYADAQYDDPRYADQRYGDQPYAEPRYDAGAAHGYADPRYPEPNFGTQQFGAPSYGAAPQGYPQGTDPQGYAAYGYPDGAQQHANAYYGAAPVASPARDEQMPARRRGSIVTVLAVLALAVVGTAAAFGYRAMFGGGAPVPPPVIKADIKPSKVVPATSSDPNAKPIQDRIGVKTEKIVPREEQPVQATAPGQPRQIAPWLAAQNSPATSSAVPPANTAAAPQSGAPEPKRIRTVPIKPDQGTDAPTPRSQSRSAPALAAQVDSDPASARAQVTGNSPLALSPSAPPPAQPQRHAARSAPSPAAAPPAAASPAAAAVASTGSPFPTPVSSGPTHAVTGSAVTGAYAVQVTSQRSEADAQSSFRSLQQQFPSVLGSRQPVIRRADLGEKGTYYRAQIPFSSQSEASEFCSNLKSAGGQCVVQRN